MLTLPIGTRKIERRRPDLGIFICSVDPSLPVCQSVVLWFKMSDREIVSMVEGDSGDREANGKEGTSRQPPNYERTSVFKV